MRGILLLPPYHWFLKRSVSALPIINGPCCIGGAQKTTPTNINCTNVARTIHNGEESSSRVTNRIDGANESNLFRSVKISWRACREFFGMLFRDSWKRRNFHQFTRQFIEDYNQKIEKDGFTIIRSADEIVFYTFIFLFAFAFPWIIILIPRKAELPKEHQEIIDNEETLSFKRFIKEYLSGGQVVSIVCYPLYGKAIAILKEDAVINGEEFIRPGLSVDLGDGFSYKQEISQQIREVEKKLGFEGQTEISIKTYELSRKEIRELRYLVIPFYIALAIALPTGLFPAGLLQRRMPITIERRIRKEKL